MGNPCSWITPTAELGESRHSLGHHKQRVSYQDSINYMNRYNLLWRSKLHQASSLTRFTEHLTNWLVSFWMRYLEIHNLFLCFCLPYSFYPVFNQPPQVRTTGSGTITGWSLQCTAVDCTAVCCSVVQCCAMQCRALEHCKVHYSALSVSWSSQGVGSNGLMTRPDSRHPSQAPSSSSLGSPRQNSTPIVWVLLCVVRV